MSAVCNFPPVTGLPCDVVGAVFGGVRAKVDAGGSIKGGFPDDIGNLRQSDGLRSSASRSTLLPIQKMFVLAVLLTDVP
jgi:hypothetical protein